MYQAKTIDSENFTNLLADFNMYKFIHKPTQIKLQSATLLDNIYTNIPINIDSCESGILTSNISDHFFVCVAFHNLQLNNDYNTYKIRNYTEKNISKFVNVCNTKLLENLVSFTIFYHFFLYKFDSIFPEKKCRLKKKDTPGCQPLY